MYKMSILLSEKGVCILLIFIALWSILFWFLSFPFLFILISILTLFNTSLFLFLDCTLLLFFTFYCHFHLPPRFLSPFLPSSPPLCVPSPQFVMVPSAGVAAVPPQYVQHAVPAPGPTRLWDPPHISSTFTFSFGLPGGKPKGLFPLHYPPVPVKCYHGLSG